MENNNLLIEVVNFYSELNNLKLVKSKKGNNLFKCKITKKYYLINLIIDLINQIVNFENNLNLDYRQIDIEIEKKENIYVNKSNYIKIINIENINYCIYNINIIEEQINKRKSQIDNRNNLKKQRIDDNDFPLEMISASSIKNYMINDPLLDYLKEYNIKSLNKKPKKKNLTLQSEQENKKLQSEQENKKLISEQENNNFINLILKAGIEFEEELVEILKRNHKIVRVGDYTNCKNKDKFDLTILLMKEGIPIIYQGVLHNYNNKTYGLCDLLVRSDYINKLMNYKVISEEEENICSEKLGTKWHYKVIDIKHSLIRLKSDGNHILNSDWMSYYKGQLYIYMKALNEVQNININKGFIWGKKYIYQNNKKKIEINNFLNKLGVVDYDNIDKNIVEETNNAIEWVREVKNNGLSWSLLPLPSRKELYPNMKNEKDENYHKIKSELNEKIYEITSVWNCGVSKREMAHNNKIYGWNNPKCNSKIMGFGKNSKIGFIVDSILNINRQNDILLKPNKILYERENWFKNKKDEMEFYLDFETININLDSIIQEGIIKEQNHNELIFLIGIGNLDLNNKWNYKYLILKEKTKECELEMFDEFYKLIKDILKINNKKIAKFYHWSNAESQIYKNFKNRNPNYFFNDEWIIFYDLCKVFINEPITIKDALDYSLKTIAKALYKHKLINSIWNTNLNGFNVMIQANNIYDKYINISNHINDKLIKEIIDYNEIDCKVLSDIHILLKNNY